MGIIEKECGICGKFFVTKNNLKKYCDECSPNSTSLKRQLHNAIENNKRKYDDPKLVEKDCAQCGRKFKTIEKLFVQFKEDDKTMDYFCCIEHRDIFQAAYMRKHRKCLNCGGSLENSSIYDPETSNHYYLHQFCSEKCNEEYKRKVAIEKGFLHTCPNCGKEFIRDGGTFCSRECYKRKNHKKENKTGDNRTVNNPPLIEVGA